MELLDRDHDYFDEIEGAMSCVIDDEQRTWYLSTREADFSGAEEKMWQEYPSTPAEAFQISTEGHYYSQNMAEVRKRGGIRTVPVADEPVHTFWDIGNSDGTAIWFMQTIAGEDRFIDYFEAHGEDLREYARQLRAKGYLYGTHFLPHDADHQRLNDRGNRSTKEMLEELLPNDDFEVLPRIEELQPQRAQHVGRGQLLRFPECSHPGKQAHAGDADRAGWAQDHDGRRRTGTAVRYGGRTHHGRRRSGRRVEEDSGLREGAQHHHPAEPAGLRGHPHAAGVPRLPQHWPQAGGVRHARRSD
ncbi:hypothetical protein [Acidovorax sp. FG27]|uniref:hypothetical protein n=1 Tax=Acidovorax sp. FG27 TaxID=3133652 RepID=UPI0033427F2A